MSAERYAYEELRNLLRVSKEELKDPEIARSFMEESVIYSAPNGRAADKVIEAIYTLSDAQVSENASKIYDLILIQFQRVRNFLH